MLALLVLLLSRLPKQQRPDPGLTRALHQTVAQALPLRAQLEAPLQHPLPVQLLHLLLLLPLSLLLLLLLFLPLLLQQGVMASKGVLPQRQLLLHLGHTCVGPDAQPGPPPLPCWLLGTA